MSTPLADLAPAYQLHVQSVARVALPPQIDLSQLMQGCQRLVVVAAHPDDETIGVGGLLATALSQSISVALIAVTDGESSHGSGDWWTSNILRTARPAETTRALRHLGWSQPIVHRLQLPDGGVAAHEISLRQQLSELLHSHDRVLCPWQHDGHADHAAIARAVANVAGQNGCACAQFPVWHRAQLEADTKHPASTRMRRIKLDAKALDCKRLAMGAYHSQLDPDPISLAAPIVTANMLEQCLVDYEVLLL